MDKKISNGNDSIDLWRCVYQRFNHFDIFRFRAQSNSRPCNAWLWGVKLLYELYSEFIWWWRQRHGPAIIALEATALANFASMEYWAQINYSQDNCSHKNCSNEHCFWIGSFSAHSVNPPKSFYASSFISVFLYEFILTINSERNVIQNKLK